MKNTYRAQVRGQAIAWLSTLTAGVTLSLVCTNATAQPVYGSKTPPQLEGLPAIGISLSCATHTRRVAEKAFLEKGSAAEEFSTVWFNASNRWLMTAFDAGVARADMAKWISVVRNSPEDAQVEDYCFRRGTQMLSQSTPDDKEIVETGTRNQLDLLRGRR